MATKIVNGFTYDLSFGPAPRWDYRTDRPLFGIVHKYDGDYEWFCYEHGDASRPDKSPDPTCKECVASLKRVARFHAYIQQDLAL